MGYVKVLEMPYFYVLDLLALKFLVDLKYQEVSNICGLCIQQVGKSSLDLSEKKFVCSLMEDLSELLIRDIVACRAKNASFSEGGQAQC